MYVQTDQLYLKPIYFDSETATQGKYQQQTMNRVTSDVVSTYGSVAQCLDSFPSSWINRKQRDHIYMYDCL